MTERDTSHLATAHSLRIGVISDTHIPEARHELWPQVFDAFAGVDCILHAGDIHDLVVIDQLSDIAPTFAARGNGDDGSGGRPIQPFDHRLKEAWLLTLGGLRVGLTHDLPIPEYPPHITLDRALNRYFGTTELDVIVFGDTHVEVVERVNGALCINPGSPTYPHNLDTQLGTIGFLEISGGKADATIWQLTDDGIAPFDWTRWKRPW
jgi:putative phosphoesterase